MGILEESITIDLLKCAIKTAQWRLMGNKKPAAATLIHYSTTLRTKLLYSTTRPQETNPSYKAELLSGGSLSRVAIQSVRPEVNSAQDRNQLAVNYFIT